MQRVTAVVETWSDAAVRVIAGAYLFVVLHWVALSVAAARKQSFYVYCLCWCILVADPVCCCCRSCLTNSVLGLLYIVQLNPHLCIVFPESARVWPNYVPTS